MPPQTQINYIILNLIKTATQIIVLLDIVALMVFVWGIIKFIAAAGNPEQLKKSRAILWWGIIAFFILASVTGFVIALQTYFGVTGGPINVIPQLGPINLPSFSGSTGGSFGGGSNPGPSNTQPTPCTNPSGDPNSAC